MKLKLYFDMTLSTSVVMSTFAARMNSDTIDHRNGSTEPNDIIAPRKIRERNDTIFLYDPEASVERVLLSAPSDAPSAIPSDMPSTFPSNMPSNPSDAPSMIPSDMPSSIPSNMPSNPSDAPSMIPSDIPSSIPSNMPSNPSDVPSMIPSDMPSDMPSMIPSNMPSNPSDVPSMIPSDMASMIPSNMPSNPSDVPSMIPSDMSSSIPSTNPSAMVLSSEPSATPSSLLSKIPSTNPSATILSTTPSTNPSASPLMIQSDEPSIAPSEEEVNVIDVSLKVNGDISQEDVEDLAESAILESLKEVRVTVASSIIDCGEIDEIDSDLDSDLDSDTCFQVDALVKIPVTAVVKPAQAASKIEGSFAEIAREIGEEVYDVELDFYSVEATAAVTPNPTPQPTSKPTQQPTLSPTKRPTRKPTSSSSSSTTSTTTSTTTRTTKKPSRKPTRRPTGKPTNSDACTDVKGFLFEGDNKKDCNWVGERLQERCPLEERSNSFLPGKNMKAKDACPSKCDRRCTCTNFLREFYFGEFSVRRTCESIRRSECSVPAGQALQKTVADLCPRKCNKCYSRSNSRQNNIFDTLYEY